MLFAPNERPYAMTQAHRSFMFIQLFPHVDPDYLEWKIFPMENPSVIKCTEGMRRQYNFFQELGVSTIMTNVLRVFENRLIICN